MMDDVFGDPAEEPQAREADGEPHREVEPEILAARKAGGHEPPCPWITRADPLEPRRREDTLPDALHARDQPGAVPFEPAPAEDEPDQEGDEERPGQARLTDVVLELRQIAAEQVTERAKDHGP